MYDMLPMMWRPRVATGELSVLPVANPLAMPSYAREQSEVRAWAMAFWQRAAMLDALDESLQAACEASALRLGVMRSDTPATA